MLLLLPVELSFLKKRGGGVQRISSSHSSYNPLAYVVTHIFADKGWTYDSIPKIKCDKRGKPLQSAEGEWLIDRNSQTGKPKFVTAAEYYAYRFHTRDDPKLNDILLDTLTFGGLLKQQFECDMYVKVEEQRLKFLQMQENQKTLKADTYSGLADAIQANEHSLAGKRIILPATFTGGPRYMHKNYQNAMAIVRKFGKPSLFITFTCNPNWREITENLRPGDQPHHRTDLIARVFHLKLKAFLKDITDKNHGVFGKKVAHAMVVEFQKRGLPHAHILLILSDSDRPVTEEDYDSYVCAEIPDPITHPRLYAMVTRHMLPGPCGFSFPNQVCMDKETGFCTKNFPKDFSEHTQQEEGSFPSYRRRCRHTFIKKGFVVNDTWVVP